MKEFFRNVSPVRAVKDLWQILGAPSEFRFRSLALALAVTFGIFSVMWQQGGRGLPRPPEVIYFESWRADRSDAEIIAGNIEATKKARAEAAEEEARAEDVRKMYKAVGAATGLDTEAMDRQGRAEREAAKRAADARNKAILEQSLVKPVATPSAKTP
ncbi:MAG: hypothetical protein KGQ75_08895 [Sphingomonadales bacterium]|uniref:hypothetical protein n=1 Tax=Novosphingobium sp. AAP93 TaxID=1523427 RepID=UPI0006B9E2D7|nr:hypothetical protein [Novosphingobium sp. AAP93]KPF86632.1 hypothetical protein IP83_07740 [Novosphingobium sp. AAP93]MBU6394677.1 hypothetical protein [Sphingomonadales bacterium]